MPRSRTNTQCNQQSLPGALALWQIGYEHAGKVARVGISLEYLLASTQLPKLRKIMPLTPPFATGLARLRERGAEQMVRFHVRRSATFWPQAGK
jgi:hypothetical protein